MRNASKFLAGLVVLALVSVVGAKDAPTSKPSLLHGHIKKIDGKVITLTIGKGEKAKDVEVTTDENTHFTIDHNPVKLEDLKEGELAAVTPIEGVATHVDINTTHKKKPADGSAPAPTADKPANPAK